MKATAKSRRCAARKAAVRRARCALSRSQTTKSGPPTFRRKCRRARITLWLEMLPRKCRAYSRPSGVTATMLETSRRLLTRRSTGVAPRGAQVVPGRWRKLWPVSSRKSSVRPSRRAFFFDRHPLAPRPGGDGALVALLGLGRGALHGEAVRLQGALEVSRVVAYAGFALD